MSGTSGGSGSIRRSRVGVLGLLLGVIVAALALRLWYLQVLQGKELRERSENNRIRLERMRPPRGRIFDRNGVELVTNRPAYNLLYYPEEVSESFNLEKLALMADLKVKDLEAALDAAKGIPSFQPRTIAYDLNYDQVARIEARLAEFGGLSVEIEPRRYYRFGKMAAHVLGTVGVMNQGQWEKLKEDPEHRFAASDYIGQSGIERFLNNELSGYPGYRRFESDAQGRKVAWIDDIDPKSGKDVHLNLDFRLQMIIEEAFGEWKGAVVAMDPRNGEVVAFHSAPGFDPNLFAGSVSADAVKEIFNDPTKPLLNRVIASAYQPGSVFKTVALMAGLKYGVVNRSTTFSCGGAAVILGDLRHCWKKGGHGAVNYRKALINSCNIFFYNVGVRVGIEPLGEFGHAVGFGQRSGIELSEENPGIMPTPEWKQRALQQPWWKGETVSVAISQGMLQITPLQSTNLMATVATGVRYKPHLVREVRAQDGGVLHKVEPEVMAKLELKPEQLALIREALLGVVEEGTGRKAKNPAFPVAGKTGTAQVVQRALSMGDNVPEKYRDHNWFSCYVSNGEEPVLALTVFIQNGGKIGMGIKAAIAGQIIASYMPLIYPERAAQFAQQQGPQGAAPEGRRSQPRRPAVEEEPIEEDEAAVEEEGR